ncbi:MAG TPA: DUF2147 domain-containing protein [Devosia sp.]|jgi:uncharacterized protein (DUF2147 family)|uniref:DUF2147 domain-containing protein n=1 Tax=Devosia sp. TaxID=1871048 RepID=UPI002DDD4868|nr:DUF2147 domain-containing protein [Devosia sp.]HEV2518691.1 DUF2147 domain-containing protein [Devosia sp.]
MAFLRELTRVAVVAMGLGLGPVAAQQALPALIEGVWLTTAQTELTIIPCPAGYCGHISKIVIPEAIKEKYGDQLEAIDPASFTDANNKDPALQGRPIQGLQILALRQTGNPMFYEGEIYSPEDGNVYSGSVEVLSVDLIRLKGCVLYVLCQEQDWSRVPVEVVAE